VTCFLPVPVDGRVAKGHDEAAKWYQVKIDGSEATCHEEIVSVKSKKQGTSASARSPRRLCPGRRNSRGAVKLINGAKFSLIDFEGQLRSCPGCGRHLIKPSELGVEVIFFGHGRNLSCEILSCPHAFATSVP
jgi:hypothetical protein